MENKNELWQLVDILRGHCNSDNYYDYAVSVAFIHKIFRKYNIMINEEQADNNIKNILLKNTTLMDNNESEISKDLIVCGLADIKTELFVKFINIYTDLNNASILNMLDQLYEQIQGRSTGMNTSISSIIELSKKLLSIKNNSSVLDMCSGYGKFLASMESNTNQLALSGIEINFNTYVISKALLYLKSLSASIFNHNVLQYDFVNEKYDYIFCEAPFGLRINNNQLDEINQNSIFPYKFNRGSGSWVFVAQVLRALKEDGKAIVVMNNAPLFQYSDSEFRKILLEAGYIEKIIRLPEKLLTETSISLSILVLSNNNHNENNTTKLIDASKVFTKGRRVNELSDKNIDEILKMIDDPIFDISLEEIANNNYNLYPTNYANDIVIENPIAIKEFTSKIFRGAQISAKMLDDIVAQEDYTYKVLNLRNIDDYVINYNDLQKVKVDHNNWDRYLLQDGDFILSAKGTKIKTAVFIKNSDEKIIASGNIMVLRLDKDKIDPFYLKIFIDSKLGDRCIKRIQTGAVILSIGKQALENMEIPNKNKDEQKLLVAKYSAQIDEINYHEHKLNELTQKIGTIFDSELGGD